MNIDKLEKLTMRMFDILLCIEKDLLSLNGLDEEQKKTTENLVTLTKLLAVELRKTIQEALKQ